MLKSMTGFGRSVKEIDGYVITVEIKSVNHRYYEFSSRIPRQYGFLDEKLKSYIGTMVGRGKIECFVTIEALNNDAAEVVVNNTLAGAYVKALKQIAEDYNLKEDFGAATISRYQDVLVVKKADEDEEKIWQYVKTLKTIFIQGVNLFLTAYHLLRSVPLKPLRNITISLLKGCTN